MNKLEFKAIPRKTGDVTVVTVDKTEIDTVGIEYGKYYKVTLELMKGKDEE